MEDLKPQFRKQLSEILSRLSCFPLARTRTFYDATEQKNPGNGVMYSVMIDATGMCGACMVPIHKEDKLLRKHACVDGPEFDAHSIDWEKLLPRFKQFNLQELRSQELKGLS